MAGPRPPFVPTPEAVVDVMLRLADVGEGDVVVDPGAGDCRVPIMAAEKYGAVGIGIEIDDALVVRCVEEIRRRGLSRAYVVYGDMYRFDYRLATVITLYLLPDSNGRLLEHWRRLGVTNVRVVSHDFEVPGLSPLATIEVGGPLRGHRLYLYRL